MSAVSIYDDFVRFMRKHDRNPANWTVGITNDPRRRGKEHAVGWMLVDRASSTNMARAVEDALLQVGCKGGPGGGRDDSRYVYMYHRSAK